MFGIMAVTPNVRCLSACLCVAGLCTALCTKLSKCVCLCVFVCVCVCVWLAVATVAHACPDNVCCAPSLCPPLPPLLLFLRPSPQVALSYYPRVNSCLLQPVCTVPLSMGRCCAPRQWGWLYQLLEMRQRYHRLHCLPLSSRVFLKWVQVQVTQCCLRFRHRFSRINVS